MALKIEGLINLEERQRNMEFCIISPTAGLERYATLSKTHLVLAQIEDPQYQQFYIKRRVAGDTLILDNGAYEKGEAIQESHFIEAINLYSPQWVVCPDAMFQPWEVTYNRTEAFLDKYWERFHSLGVKFMGIPHTTPGDIMGWLEGMLRMMEDFPVDGVGLPRALATHYYPDPTVRVNACKLLRRRYDRHISDLYIHAFGMVNGDVTELSALAGAGCNSIDSSAPVWRGWNELTLTNPDDRKVWDLKGIECNFEAVHLDFDLPNSGYERRIHPKILSNLEACGVDTKRSVNI